MLARLAECLGAAVAHELGAGSGFDVFLAATTEKALSGTAALASTQARVLKHEEAMLRARHALESAVAQKTAETRITLNKALCGLVHASHSRASRGEELLAPLSAVQREWLLVFVRLCRLEEIADPQGEKRQRESLNLVLTMVTKCPARFRTSEPVVTLLRNVLFPALITASVSTHPKVVDISLRIFIDLARLWKEQLKPQIGIFIDELVLRILDSGNSTHHLKYRALQVFNKLCQEAVVALELFLNFDCNVEEKNIFERVIECLSKIAQGKYSDPEHTALITPEKELELRKLALGALTRLMSALKEWLKKKTEAGEAPGDASAKHGHSMSRSFSAEDRESNSDAADGHEPQPDENVDGLSVCEQKQRKRDLQNGIHKFNLKPKRGIEHLRQGGFVNEHPQSMAELFKNVDLGLDKTAIGDFLGEDKPFNMKVLDALIAGLAFAGSELDAALRAFLALFRLPGEAQKISRMMEKFAEKYCQDNPGKFSNTDCAFVLSFSLIMLQTDLHNPGVKHKMTKDQFVTNNRGIDNGKNLERDYLESLYDSVAANPMSLKEDEEAKSKLESQAAQSLEARARLFQKESKVIVSRSLELMAQRSLRRRSAVYVHAERPEHARPLFEVLSKSLHRVAAWKVRLRPRWRWEERPNLFRPAGATAVSPNSPRAFTDYGPYLPDAHDTHLGRVRATFYNTANTWQR